jgi:hypothetical protein
VWPTLVALQSHRVFSTIVHCMDGSVSFKPYCSGLDRPWTFGYETTLTNYEPGVLLRRYRRCHSQRSRILDMVRHERSRILLRAVALLRERNDALAGIKTTDTEKPFSETGTPDVLTSTEVLESVWREKVYQYF